MVFSCPITAGVTAGTGFSCDMMNESQTASVHGVPGERARATGVMRAVWPLLTAIFLCGMFLGAALPRIVPGVAGAGFLLAALTLVWAVRDGLRGIEGYFKGARGEEAVAALLASLPFGYHVFHDVACGQAGGIDHVAVGPKGLFVIETKCWAGQVVLEGGELLVNGKRPNRSPIAQVRASAHALSLFLEEKLEDVPTCCPLVCFASNTLVPDTVKQDDTWICNSSVLLSLISGYPGRLSPDDIERIVKVLERKAS